MITNIENDKNNINNLESFIVLNENLRTHIKLGLSIYKKLNNFNHNYIHDIFIQKSENTK